MIIYKLFWLYYQDLTEQLFAIFLFTTYTPKCLCGSNKEFEIIVILLLADIDAFSHVVNLLAFIIKTRDGYNQRRTGKAAFI
jgi:hypothetical protein